MNLDNMANEYSLTQEDTDKTARLFCEKDFKAGYNAAINELGKKAEGFRMWKIVVSHFAPEHGIAVYPAKDFVDLNHVDVIELSALFALTAKIALLEEENRNCISLYLHEQRMKQVEDELEKARRREHVSLDLFLEMKSEIKEKTEALENISYDPSSRADFESNDDESEVDYWFKHAISYRNQARAILTKYGGAK